MEEQERASKQAEQDDVEAHIRPRSKLQEDVEGVDEQGLRLRAAARDGDDDDDVEAHRRF